MTDGIGSSPPCDSDKDKTNRMDGWICCLITYETKAPSNFLKLSSGPDRGLCQADSGCWAFCLTTLL